MNNTKQLMGSLSNDLLRLSTFVHNGSPSARRFMTEAKRWASQLADIELPQYLAMIVQDINDAPSTMPTLSQAEKYLMYSVLLQNYVLHS